MKRLTCAIIVALAIGGVAAAQPGPAALYTDPPADTVAPATSEVLHIPSGAVSINGLAYLAAGAGPHPTVVFFHGLPGNEKNLDLAQVIRRSGWNVVTLNYRGSWGSPGAFSFAGTLDDAKAALAYVRAPQNASRLRIDTRRLVIAGHSMGGWVTAFTAAQDPALTGAILISAADMGLDGTWPRAEVGAEMANSMESLAGTSPQAMADELIGNTVAFRFERAAAGLAKTPLLVLSSDDGLQPHTDALIAGIGKAGGGALVTARHHATDHSWNTARVRLATEVIGWLQALPKP